MRLFDDFFSPRISIFCCTVDSPKKKIRKIERKLVPVVQKLSTDELMESNTYQRFSQCVDLIFENTEDLDLNAELGKTI
jgi:hypothetical protein